MPDKMGNTKSGDRVHLHIEEEDHQYTVCWIGLCGYDIVALKFDFASEAEAFFNAVQQVTEIEED